MKVSLMYESKSLLESSELKLTSRWSSLYFSPHANKNNYIFWQLFCVFLSVTVVGWRGREEMTMLVDLWPVGVERISVFSWYILFFFFLEKIYSTNCMDFYWRPNSYNFLFICAWRTCPLVWLRNNWIHFELW